MKLKKKKTKSGVLKHDILREFEISKLTYYRFIFREHVSFVEKFTETEVFINYFLCFNCFYPFLINKKLMNIILTCDTKYGPVCLPFDFSMTLSDSWDTPPSNPNNRRSSIAKYQK